jgi:branched-chain amino acid transport system substrate-binding protein
MHRRNDKQSKIASTRRDFLVGAAGIGGAALGSGIFAPVVRAEMNAPVKIGCLISQSKVFAVQGVNILDGMSLYFEGINWQAGGRKIQLIKEDDEVSPQLGLEKIKKMVESDQVDIVTGPVGSNVALAIMGYVRQSNCILVVNGAGVNAVTRKFKSNNIFRCSTTSWQSNAPAGEWLYKNAVKELVIVASDYSGGHEAIDGFKEGFLPAGGKIVNEIWAPFNNSDFSSYLAQIKATGVSTVYAYMTGADAVRFVTQFNEFGLKKDIKLTGTGFMVEDDSLPAEGDAALGTLTGLHYTSSLDTPANKKFVAEYKAKYGQYPSCYSEYGYVSARIIAEALKTTQGDAGDKKKLEQAIQAVSFDAPRGPFRFDPETQNVIQNIYIRKVVRAGDRLENEVLATIPKIRDPG